MAAHSPLNPVPQGVAVRLRVTPKAKHESVGPIVADGNGPGALKIAVTAPPADGQANKAVIRLLAKTWRLPRTAIEITQGGHDRNKVALIHGETGVLMAALTKRLSA